MSGLSAFLRENVEEIKHVKYPASRLYKDEKGKPIEWEIKMLESEEISQIRKVCTNVIGVGKKIVVDNERFNRMFAAKATVFPNLNDKELQDSYGVFEPDKLIIKLLKIDAEYQAYVQKVLEVSGYNQTDEELVEEAKN